MAEKSSSRSQGRSKSPSQAKGRGRAGRQKRNPDRGGGKSAANGAAGRQSRSDASQPKGRGRKPEASSGQDEGGQEESRQSGAVGKVGETLKQHPITAAALGAGLTLLAAQGLRIALGAGGGNASHEKGESSEAASKSDADEGGDEGGARNGSDSGAEAEEDQDEDNEGEGFADRLRQGASSLGRVGSKFGSAFRGSGDAIKRGARSGFDRGRQGAEQSWTSHPLTMCGVALAVGAAAGFLLPATSQEDRLMGSASDKVAGRFRKSGLEVFRQGRSIAGRALHEAVSASARESEREGLTPDRLGQKLKRVISNVRNAVAEAVQED